MDLRIDMKGLLFIFFIIYQGLRGASSQIQQQQPQQLPQLTGQTVIQQPQRSAPTFLGQMLANMINYKLRWLSVLADRLAGNSTGWPNAYYTPTTAQFTPTPHQGIAATHPNTHSSEAKSHAATSHVSPLHALPSAAVAHSPTTLRSPAAAPHPMLNAQNPQVPAIHASPQVHSSPHVAPQAVQSPQALTHASHQAYSPPPKTPVAPQTVHSPQSPTHASPQTHTAPSPSHTQPAHHAQAKPAAHVSPQAHSPLTSSTQPGHTPGAQASLGHSSPAHSHSAQPVHSSLAPAGSHTLAHTPSPAPGIHSAQPTHQQQPTAAHTPSAKPQPTAAHSPTSQHPTAAAHSPTSQHPPAAAHLPASHHPPSAAHKPTTQQPAVAPQAATPVQTPTSSQLQAPTAPQMPPAPSTDTDAAEITIDPTLSDSSLEPSSATQEIPIQDAEDTQESPVDGDTSSSGDEEITPQQVLTATLTNMLSEPEASVIDQDGQTPVAIPVADIVEEEAPAPTPSAPDQSALDGYF